MLPMIVDYSLVKLDSEDDNISSVAYLDNPKIEITKKGKVCLDLIYSDIDILYHCSLDTPVPKLLIDHKFIQPHNNNMNKHNFAICCLKSSLSFIQYLKNIDSEERNYIDTLGKKGLSYKFILPWSKNVKIQEYLINRLNYLKGSLNESASKDFEVLKKSFQRS